MAGLMKPEDARAARNTPMRNDAMAGGAPREAPGGDQPQPNVTPEEQAQYERFVNNGLTLIYDDKTLPKVIEMLRGDGDPKEGLANAAAMVVMRLEDSAGDQGQPIPDDIVYHGGIEILSDLANLANEAGIHEFTDDEIEGATYRALDIYREARQAEGQLPGDDIQQDFQQIMQADQHGGLEQIAPGLEGHFAGAAEGMAPDVAGHEQQRGGRRR